MKTCSKECAKISYTRSRTGQKWTAEARQRLSKKRGRPPQLLLGTEAAKASPLAGGYETNFRAQWWTLQSPEGIIHHVRNLSLFCRNTAPLYGSTAESMQTAVSAMKSWRRGRSKHKVESWKGWRLIEYEEVDDQWNGTSK